MIECLEMIPSEASKNFILKLIKAKNLIKLWAKKKNIKLMKMIQLQC